MTKAEKALNLADFHSSWCKKPSTSDDGDGDGDGDENDGDGDENDDDDDDDDDEYDDPTAVLDFKDSADLSEAPKHSFLSIAGKQLWLDPRNLGGRVSPCAAA